MLEGVFKGLFLWMYGLVLECVEYMANALLDVFTMDITFFETYVPVVTEMIKIFVAVGWALLIGNLAFQAMKGMVNGLGYEPEDPKILFCRSIVFSFLLFASPEICKTGMTLTNKITALLKVPDSVVINLPGENAFGIGSSWLLTVIIGIILMFQLVKFFFEIGERYVVTCILTFLSPLAFAMGGSKATKDIFTGWCRMFGSMCFIMVMNVFFMKLLLSAMSTVPSGLIVFPWVIFVFGLAKVGRKIDDIVCRIGLNAPHTGGGKMMPGALTMLMARTAMSTISKTTAAANASRGGAGMPSEQDGKQTKPKGRAFNGFSQNSMSNPSASNANSSQKTQETAPEQRMQGGNSNKGKAFNKKASFPVGTQGAPKKYNEAMLDIECPEDYSNNSSANNADNGNISGDTPRRPPLRGVAIAGVQSVKAANLNGNNSETENRMPKANNTGYDNQLQKSGVNSIAGKNNYKPESNSNDGYGNSRHRNTSENTQALSKHSSGANTGGTEKPLQSGSVLKNAQAPYSVTGKGALPKPQFSVNDTGAFRSSKNTDTTVAGALTQPSQKTEQAKPSAKTQAPQSVTGNGDKQGSGTRQESRITQSSHITEMCANSNISSKNGQASHSNTETGGVAALKNEQTNKTQKSAQNSNPKEVSSNGRRPKQRR